MAHLSGPNGSVDLHVVGYEFPDATEDDYDANWLTLRVSARRGDEEWSATDAALLTWEFMRLTTWMRELANRSLPLPASFDAIESSLGFTAQEPSLVAHLAHGLRPPEEPPVSIDLRPTPAELLAFVEELESFGRAFPIRVVERNGPAMRQSR